MNNAHRIGIVGAGFTGSLLAAHLAREARTPMEILLIERRGRFGPGLAYSTDDANHLLNVRAANMSAFPDDPDHFLRWLARRNGESARENAVKLRFASRRDYGVYVADVLEQATAAAAPGVRLQRISGEAVGLTPIPGGVRLLLDGLRHLDVQQAALCTGHLPPLPPPGVSIDVLASDRYIADPWEEGALARIGRDARALILGSGLTMVDVVLSLIAGGHRGDILALSRRGLLPTDHADIQPFASQLDPRNFPTTTRGLFRALRREAARAEMEGAGWRSAFDALRPYHHRLWCGLSLDERRRFMRHARSYWDTHRHRMAPEAARRIADLRASGQLSVRAGVTSPGVV